METTGQPVFFGPLHQYGTPVPDIPMFCCRLDGFWQRGAAENAHLKTEAPCRRFGQTSGSTGHIATPFSVGRTLIAVAWFWTAWKDGIDKQVHLSIITTALVETKENT